MVCGIECGKKEVHVTGFGRSRPFSELIDVNVSDCDVDMYALERLAQQHYQLEELYS